MTNHKSVKILLLADAKNYHTRKWALGLYERGVQVKVVSLNKDGHDFFQGKTGFSSCSLGFSDSFVKKGGVSKLLYLKVIFQIKNIIKEFDPDIVHSHYVSSYGLLGALTKNRKFIISVWGSDIYDFPKKSWFHKIIVKYALSRADYVCSTSICMKQVAKKYTSKMIAVIPFGVNTNFFSPQNINKKSSIFHIGIVKSLSPKYGIDTLLKAVSIVIHEKKLNVKLDIVGDGIYRAEYEKLARSLNIDKCVRFFGFIDKQEIPTFLNKLDVFVALSRLDSESFGVAVVEAMSCEIPVIVSNVDGFKEVIHKGLGRCVEKDNPVEAADAIEWVYKNRNIAKEKAKCARKKVIKEYDFEINLTQQIFIYKKLLNEKAIS